MLQYSVALRNNQLDQVESTLGNSPQLLIRTGVPPANCAAAETGTVLATVLLPVDWMSAASAGTKTMLGTWQDLSADGTGVAGHFRLKDATGTTCHVQGTVGATGSGAEMEVDNVNFNAGQAFTVNQFTLSAGNA